MSETESLNAMNANEDDDTEGHAMHAHDDGDSLNAMHQSGGEDGESLNAMHAKDDDEDDVEGHAMHAEGGDGEGDDDKRTNAFR